MNTLVKAALFAIMLAGVSLAGAHISSGTPLPSMGLQISHHFSHFAND